MLEKNLLYFNTGSNGMGIHQYNYISVALLLTLASLSGVGPYIIRIIIFFRTPATGAAKPWEHPHEHLQPIVSHHWQM